MSQESADTRTGYVTLVGRPNAGKSTLMNQLVGQHLSIVTPKAQTTWQRVTGILTTGANQLIFLDTPGLLEARDLFQRSMLGAALEALNEADVVLVVVDTLRPPSSTDIERLESALSQTRAPVHIALNKVDAALEESVEAWTDWCSTRPATVHRLSALTGAGTDSLLQGLIGDLPPGPFLYPEDDVASDPVRFFAAELVRETVFEQYDEEIPYSVFCQVGEFREEQDPIYIQVNVFVERSSQKGILIGAGGHAIRQLGQTAREKIEHFLGQRVYLDLWVKPLKSWRKNRARLGSFGFRVPEDDETGRS
ncbi:MAG TPA: GTPase Era [Longimicrobiales bacterium]|nr:GTPase Era [Longimicrobiales bacterium]